MAIYRASTTVRKVEVGVDPVVVGDQIDLETDVSETFPGSPAVLTATHPDPLRVAFMRLSTSVGTYSPEVPEDLELAESEQVKFYSGKGSASKQVWRIHNYEWIGNDDGAITVSKDRRTLVSAGLERVAVATVNYFRRVGRWTLNCYQDALQIALVEEVKIWAAAEVIYTSGDPQFDSAGLTLMHTPDNPDPAQDCLLLMYTQDLGLFRAPHEPYGWSTTVGVLTAMPGSISESEKIEGESVTITDSAGTLTYGGKLDGFEPGTGYEGLVIQIVPPGSNKLVANMQNAIVSVNYTTERRGKILKLLEQSTAFVTVIQTADGVEIVDQITYGAVQGPVNASVRIRDRMTQTYVSGALVQIGDYPPKLTDQDGRATWTGVTPGRYALRITKTGYQDNTVDHLANDFIQVPGG